MKQLILFLMLLSPVFVQAGKADTVWMHSDCRSESVPLLIVFPENYDSLTPVIVLLHGWGGDFASWVRNSGKLPDLADEFDVIFFAPNAGNSWYFDTDSRDSAWCGETIVVTELLAFAENKYGLSLHRDRTAICGLSMGGHGALHLAGKHPESFGIVGSMSGVVRLSDSRIAEQVREDFGGGDSLFLHTASMINQIEMFKPFSGNIYLDCGYSDHLYPSNADFHHALLEAGIGHLWMARPGYHDWRFWDESIEYFMVFFSQQRREY